MLSRRDIDTDSSLGGIGSEETSASALQRFFDTCESSFAQQTPAWCRVIESMGEDRSRLIVARHEGQIVGVLPAHRFEGPHGAIQVSCAQAGPLGGVACGSQVDRESVYSALIDAFVSLAAESGCALATIITNPFWPDRDLCSRALGPDFELENVCQVLSLDDAVTEDGHFVHGSANLRRNLKKARAANLVVDEAQTRANVAEWYAIHVARQRKIGVEPLPEALFMGALEYAVPAEKARFFFMRLASGKAADGGRGGEMVAGALNLQHGRVMDALMPSVRDEFASLGGNFLLAQHAILWAKRQGLNYYNWQPSPPGSGVYRFKRQWGSRDVSYAYLTKITGDATAFLNGSVDSVRNGYRWHYALPFDRIGSGSQAGGVSSRSDAWSAANR